MFLVGFKLRYSKWLSNDFLVELGQQRSVLSPMLFIIPLKALFREIRSRCPEKLLYADDLALTISESLEGLKGRLEVWKVALGTKGLSRI